MEYRDIEEPAGEINAIRWRIASLFSEAAQPRDSTPHRLQADGFDEDQQFFLSFGQSECTKWREARQRTLLQTDTHSPPRFRVNGAVTNMPGFASALSCAEGKALNPRQRCDIW